MGVVVAALTIAQPRSSRYDELAHDAWQRQPDPLLEDESRRALPPAGRRGKWRVERTKQPPTEENMGIWDETAKELGVGKTTLHNVATKLGIKVSTATAEQKEAMRAELAKAKTTRPTLKPLPKERRERAIAAAAERSKSLRGTEPAPERPQVVDSAVDDDLELRVLRAFYPDGISPDQYPRALRVLCLAAEVEP